MIPATNRFWNLTVVGMLACVIPAGLHAESDSAAKDALPQIVVDKAETSRQAFELLRTRCYQCHGEQSQFENLDVLDQRIMLKNFVTPGEPQKSAIWNVIKDNRMPKGASSEPESRNRPF